MLKINTTCLQSCDVLALSVTRPLVVFMAQYLGWETKMYHGVQHMRLFGDKPTRQNIPAGIVNYRVGSTRRPELRIAE